MATRTYAEPVGILCGRIVINSPVLLLWLMEEPSGVCHVRVHTDSAANDAFEAALKLAKELSPQVKRFWKSDSEPAWYYIQLYDNYPPGRLYEWNCPWSVYDNWRKLIVRDKPGLV